MVMKFETEERIGRLFIYLKWERQRSSTASISNHQRPQPKQCHDP